MKEILKNTEEQKARIQQIKLLRIPLSIYLITLCLFFVFTATITAQQSPSELIVGTWLFSEEPSMEAMSSENMTYIDNNPEIRSNLLNGYRGRTLSFMANGDFIQGMGNGQQIMGNWELQDNLLIVSDSNGHSFMQQIGEVTGNSLVLLMESSENMRPFFETIYYTKI